MATIKALEGRTVHQIQSGQVIVDLCSVVKELVENSLDAQATSIEVRFKNNGLDSIEVQDNGVGISSENYETIALKHYTSKLSSYDDLSSLQTFGFRGEALSSLCALSKFYVITARADEAPKGTKLDFETSGKLKGTHVVASQRGTTMAVEDLFMNLPVRRRELEKNIKREYGKVLGILQAYACISTQARISVSNVMARGKKATVFATKSNQSTRENIANVFGAKALNGLVSMDLNFELQPTKTYSHLSETENKRVRVLGHVSRPTFGEGRHAPDRQMFFVNKRPCGLPQVAKVFNEVYKSYNISQSPFVFADILLDTNAYDVNVSPDKRTILLHEQNTLLDMLRGSLTELFESEDQTVPQSWKPNQKLPSFKPLDLRRESSGASDKSVFKLPDFFQTSINIEADSSTREYTPSATNDPNQDDSVNGLIEDFVGRDTGERVNKPAHAIVAEENPKTLSRDKQKLIKKLGKEISSLSKADEYEDPRDLAGFDAISNGVAKSVEDFNQRIAEQQPYHAGESDTSSAEETQKNELVDKPQARNPVGGVVQNAFDRMRPRRKTPEVATITIGSKTTTSVLGSSSLSQRRRTDPTPSTPIRSRALVNDPARQKFGSSMRSFAAPGSQLLRTVGKPQSKSRVSVKYAEKAIDDETFGNSSDDDSMASAYDDGEYGPASCTPEVDCGLTSGPEEQSVSEDESDDEYLDEEDKKSTEEARVAELIRQAEQSSALPSQDNKRRAHQLLKGTGQKNSTTSLVQIVDASVRRIEEQLERLEDALQSSVEATHIPKSETTPPIDGVSAEERLSLAVSKDDFANMRVTGQFNLGFILATRNNTDLFIIDQHASDEKYNFERLQATTIVQNQRLVHPQPLELTAIEEEIVLENNDALLKNGFLIDIDTSGDLPVGQRCKVLSLPMSKEVTFDTTDLEELITFLADNPSSSTTNTPRPSKVRRMFAMRACRNSIMVGKTLTLKHMGALVRKMGDIDKPWNCPHGRPTMRHVCNLEGWRGWEEGEGIFGMEEEALGIDWKGWVQGKMEEEQEAKCADEDQGEDIEVQHNEDEGEE
ncbi:hypothetical protein N7G274_010643 [Stereocaulon virgatum]|uniref:DNA mismatch repair protein MutL n=1 Tax=Stereocaulon virgatum TaxID=373712 RepID=A0ABR3ZX36_9LECA